MDYSERPIIMETNLIRKYIVRGLIFGIVLAVLNVFTLGFGGKFLFSFMVPLFVRGHDKSYSTCDGENCWGLLIIVGSILFTFFTPLFFAIFAYIKDKENYPLSRKKIFILTFVLFLFFAINLWGFLEKSFGNLLVNNSILIHRSDYKSLDECNELIFTGSDLDSQKGDCYGHFASKNDDENICYQVINSGKLESIDEAIYSCLSVYGLSKNDINYCKDQEGNYNQSCVFRYSAMKDYKKGCYLIEKNYYREKCDRWVNFLTYIALKYGEFKRGPSVNMSWYRGMDVNVRNRFLEKVETPKIELEENTEESLKKLLENLYNYFILVKRNSENSVLSNSIREKHLGEEFKKNKDNFYLTYGKDKHLSLQGMEYLFCHTSIPEKIEFQQIKISNQNSFVIADEYMEKKRIHIQIPIYVEWIEEKNQWEITKVDCDNYKNIIN